MLLLEQSTVAVITAAIETQTEFRETILDCAGTIANCSGSSSSPIVIASLLLVIQRPLQQRQKLRRERDGHQQLVNCERRTTATIDGHDRGASKLCGRSDVVVGTGRCAGAS